MKFGDEDIFGSSKDINSNLREVIVSLDGEVGNQVHKKENDYPLFALRALSNYAGVLFDRLTSNQDFPIEYNAILARNLFECYLIIAYIIKNPSKGEEFIGQKAQEELEINEGFLSLTNEKTPGAIKKQIQDRMDYVRNLMKDHNLTLSKNWTVSHLADQTNNTLEYKAFFKLYSKYVHPSSWIVNSHKEEYGNPVFKNIFVLQGHHYAGCITKLISKYLSERTTT